MNSQTVKQLLSRWDYAPEAVETYGRAMEAAWDHPGAGELLRGVISAYESGTAIEMRDVLTAMDGFAAECGEIPYTMRMLPYLCLLEPAEARYSAAGIGEDVIRTLSQTCCGKPENATRFTASGVRLSPHGFTASLSSSALRWDGCSSSLPRSRRMDLLRAESV